MAPVDVSTAGRPRSPVHASLRLGQNRGKTGPAVRASRRHSPEAAVQARSPKVSLPAVPWSLDRVLWLCDARTFSGSFPPQAKLLDASVGSTLKAVKLLNLGILYCPEDLCIVFNQPDQGYYLLYRRGSKEAALEATEEMMVTSGPCSPRCTTPSFSRRAQRCSETPPKLRNNLPGASAPPPCASSAPQPGLQRNVSGCSPPSSPVATVQCRAEGPGLAGASPVSFMEALGASKATGTSGSTWASTTQDQEEAAELVDVGGRLFRLQGILGRGAFGVVWRAREQREQGGDEGSTCAIKAMSASSDEGFGTALFEAELLRRLSSQLPAEAGDRVPRYIAHNARRTGAGGAVHVAMSFLPGQVLDQWLYGISDEAHKHVDVNKIVHGNLAGSRQRSLSLERTSSLVHALLQQLAGVFDALQPLALHRDVSSHNVLLDLGAPARDAPNETESGLAPSFALIDFGLAVSSSSWSREWNTSNLAGDPRYWTPAAWSALALGFRHVETHANRGFQRQYLTRIDHYSLGVLGLELFFALWDPDREESAPGLRHARTAWCALWDLKFRLFQMFHLQGARHTQQFLEHSPQNPLERFGELLSCVYCSLRSAAAQPANAEYAVLLRVLADLVDEHGTLSWREISNALSAPRAPPVRSPLPPSRPTSPAVSPVSAPRSPISLGLGDRRPGGLAHSGSTSCASPLLGPGRVVSHGPGTPLGRRFSLGPAGTPGACRIGA